MRFEIPSCPYFQIELLVLRCAITQVKIDQALVWDSALVAKAARIVDHIFVQPDG
jgi:hypothetical protein